MNKLFLFPAILFLVSCLSKGPAVSFSVMKEGEICTDPGFSQGLAWADIDKDGDEDLFVTNSWTNEDNLFYINNSDGTFTNEDNQILSNDKGNSNACSWGDLNNDGYPDLFVANVNNQNNFLYMNNGDGSFTKIDSMQASTDGGWSYAASWADFDKDGWLDLFVGNYNEQSNFIYFNDGTGTLVRDTLSIVSQSHHSTQGVSCFDYDNDGWPDIYVTNNGQNELYRNLQDGNFQKIEQGILVEAKHNSFGCSAADYNNDGWMDLLVANWSGKNDLYENVGQSGFVAIRDTVVTQEYLNSEGSAWGDMDNDGDLDLMVTNDGNNSLFENDGGNFTKRTDLNVCQDNSNSNGVTWNDFDNDGDLDIFIANGGNQPNLFYTNNGNKNNWIKLKCVGTASNHSAIGTKVIVYQNIRTQTRVISGQDGGGYGSQNGLIQHFGLGKKGKIDSIQVIWPSGKISNLFKPEVNTILSISES